MGGGRAADIAFVIDQSHNLKGKIEAMIQTVVMAQALYAKAAIVDYPRLAAAQRANDLVAAEILPSGRVRDRRAAAIAEWRRSRRACRSIRSRRSARAAICDASRSERAVNAAEGSLGVGLARRDWRGLKVGLNAQFM